MSAGGVVSLMGLHARILHRKLHPLGRIGAFRQHRVADAALRRGRARNQSRSAAAPRSHDRLLCRGVSGRMSTWAPPEFPKHRAARPSAACIRYPGQTPAFRRPLQALTKLQWLHPDEPSATKALCGSHRRFDFRSHLRAYSSILIGASLMMSRRHDGTRRLSLVQLHAQSSLLR